VRRLCFGGSFNPIHHGHLLCARAAAEAGGFDRVVLIPSAVPPHKAGTADMAPPQHRLAMCELAVAGDAYFEVDGLELRRTGPSYTIDTARALRRRGWNEVHWLIGADMLPGLPNWHEPAALLREVRFVVMARPGWSFDWDALPLEYRPLQQQVTPAHLIDLSATAVRRRVACGRSIKYMTPPAVADYITNHALYTTRSAGDVFAHEGRRERKTL
jgi:nicotinate-nucleotide adenylyltransferase